MSSPRTLLGLVRIIEAPRDDKMGPEVHQGIGMLRRLLPPLMFHQILKKSMNYATKLSVDVF